MHQGSIFYIELPLLNNHSTASNPSAKTPAHITLCNSDPAQPSQRASDDTKSAQ
jgi:hypothetical protein